MFITLNSKLQVAYEIVFKEIRNYYCKCYSTYFITDIYYWLRNSLGKCFKISITFSKKDRLFFSLNPVYVLWLKKNGFEKKNIQSEINVIGLNTDEAIFIVDKYLDDARLYHIPSVRIVHGKGTGTLRKAIHNFLKSNKNVKSFRLGTYGEGEMGVTVVEIQ